jgi:hypothetical protein
VQTGGIQSGGSNYIQRGPPQAEEGEEREGEGEGEGGEAASGIGSSSRIGTRSGIGTSSGIGTTSTVEREARPGEYRVRFRVRA